MSWPTVTVKLGSAAASNSFTLDDGNEGRLNSGELGDDLGIAWVEVTTDVLQDSGITVERGATRNEGPTFRYETGRCTFDLDNDSGDYDPLNLGSQFVSGGVNKLGPGLPVSVSASIAGETRTLFVGYVDSWQVAYPGVANTKSVVRVSAVDATGILAAAKSAEQESQGDLDDATTRIARILNNAGWPAAARDIQADPLETFLPTTLSDSAWEELQQVTESTAGYLFVNVDGALCYRDKSKFPRSADFTVGEGFIETTAMEIAADWAQIYNCVRLSNETVGELSGRDETSVARFGLRTYENQNMVLDTEQQLSTLVTHFLSQSKDLRLRVESVRLELKDDNSDSEWLQMLGLEILNRIATTFQTTDARTINQDVLVRGIDLTIQPFNWNWSVSTSAVPFTVGNFTLDDGYYGRLANYGFWQQEIIAAYYENLVAIYGNNPFFPVNADDLFEGGRDVITSNLLGDTWYPFRVFLVSVQNLPADAYLQFEDWAPMSFAEWQASIGAYAVTVEDAPTLALF